MYQSMQIIKLKEIQMKFVSSTPIGIFKLVWLEVPT